MDHKNTISTLILLVLIFAACSGQEKAGEESGNKYKMPVPGQNNTKKPHQYGGWYCPDNFGFVPVNIQNLDEVPAISNRLPKHQELQDHMSLIEVDTFKFPDARALKMDLPRLARIYLDWKGMSELIIVIQAIIVSEDTVVGYRFPNGGNGSARIGNVNFLSDEEISKLGSQPFFYSQTKLHSTKEELWKAISKTEYAKELGVKFDQTDFFSSEWNPNAQAHLNYNTKEERAKGHIGMVYGNLYLHIDYIRDGFHYSEKLLMIENQEDNTTELFIASGPYPDDFDKQKLHWSNWLVSVVESTEAE